MVLLYFAKSHAGGDDECPRYLSPAPVRFANSVLAARDELENRDFDAVLLDLGLDGQASPEIAGRLMELNVPFAFVTGYTRPFEPRHAMVPLLHKPFTVGQLRDVLHALIGPPQLYATKNCGLSLAARAALRGGLSDQALTRCKSRRGTISSFAPFLAHSVFCFHLRIVCRQNWIGYKSRNIRGRE